MIGAIDSMYGIRLIPSLTMVEHMHVGDWLNGYVASANRSERTKKKLLKGTRKTRKIITPIIESRPKNEVFQLPNGDIVAHPFIIEEIKRQTEMMGNQLGMPKLSKSKGDDL